MIVAVPPPSLPLTVERSGSAARLKLAWAWGEAAAAYAVTPTTSRRLDATRTGDQIELAIDCADPVAIEIRAGARVIATVVDACAPELATGELPPALDLGPPAHTPVEIEMRVWALVNRERVAHGVAAVGWDAAGHRFARVHAADMARLRYVGHEAPDGASYRERVAGRRSGPWPRTRTWATRGARPRCTRPSCAAPDIAPTCSPTTSIAVPSASPSTWAIPARSTSASSFASDAPRGWRS